jgi:broad specificity phosphatase PhoE
MPTVFLLVRHGQTDWNKEIRFRGTTDLPLTPFGHAQAQRVAERLRSEPIAAIYSSPLSRAVETARPLAEALGLPIQIHHGLISVDYGEWQGHTPQEVSGLWLDLYRLWMQSPDQVTFPGGESLPIALDRAVALLNELSETPHGQTVALFSHEIVTRAVMLYILGMNLSAYWRMPQDTACINAFSYDPLKRSLFYLNDTCHVRGLDVK